MNERCEIENSNYENQKYNKTQCIEIDARIKNSKGRVIEKKLDAKATQKRHAIRQKKAPR